MGVLQRRFLRLSSPTMSTFRRMYDGFLNWLRSLFWKQEMELTMVGLQNAGKTTLVGVFATVGFSMRKVTKGSVTIKLWDLGGQPRFCSMWERYCRGVNAIVYVCDSAEHDQIELAKNELHDLMKKPALANIPLLVLGNKNDKPEAPSCEELIEKMSLKEITGREVCCYSISAKERRNIDITMEWLMKHSKPPKS